MDEPDEVPATADGEDGATVAEVAGALVPWTIQTDDGSSVARREASRTHLRRSFRIACRRCARDRDSRATHSLADDPDKNRVMYEKGASAAP